MIDSVDSTIAYQAYGKKVKLNFINEIHKIILGKLKPDITFVLKVSQSPQEKDCLNEDQKIGMIGFHNLFTIKYKNHL